MVGKNVQIYGVHIPRKCIESSHFFSIPPSPLKTLPQALIITLPRQMEITYSPRQHFFEHLVSPAAERGGGIYDVLINIQSENMKITWNIRLFTFCMICIFFKCDGFTVL